MTKAVVIGGGVSGYGAAMLLRKDALDVLVSNGTKLSSEQRNKFEKLGVSVKDDGHEVSHLDGAELVVVSPGLPTNHPLVVEAHKRGIPCKSEIDLALEKFHGKIIAVTGTNGKSTVCKMIGHMLEASGKSVSVCGNIGVSPSELMAQGAAAEILVIELSSYQLETSTMVDYDVAVLTSFSMDHLERHKTMGEYFLAKAKIFQSRKLKEAIYSNKIIEYLDQYKMQFAVSTKIIEDEYEANKELLEGKSHVFSINAVTAMSAVRALFSDLNSRDLVESLKNYESLPFRSVCIGKINGHEVINDSKSTNLESTWVCVEGQVGEFDLMVGGASKGEDFAELSQMASSVRRLICFGKDGTKIASDLKMLPSVEVYKTLKEALEKLASEPKSERSCPLVFSPGCASFDEFENFEKRGAYFNAMIAGLLDS